MFDVIRGTSDMGWRMAFLAGGLLLWASMVSAGLDDGLVAYYPFHGDAKDAGAHGYHGSVRGCTPTKDHRGAGNYAYEFDGVDDYIYFGPVLPDMDTMTVSLWVCSDEPASGDPAKDSVLFSDGDWTLGNDVYLTTNSDSVIALRADKNEFSFYWTVSSSVPLHQSWRHLVWVMTGTDSGVYVDGQKIATLPAGGSNRGNHDFLLGTEEFPQGQFGRIRGYWKGKVACLRIYNRGLSDSEIQDLYQMDLLAGGSTAGPSAEVDLTRGLVADYPLDGHADDVSGHGRHGTVQGATLTQDQNGKPNGAYKFDGLDDYLSFGDALPDMNGMTVSLWVRCDPGGSGSSIFVDGDGTAGNDVLFGVNASNEVVLVANKPGGGLDAQVTVAPALIAQWRHFVWILADVWTAVCIDGVEHVVLERGGPNKGFHHLLLGTQEYPPGHPGVQGFWKGEISSLKVYDRILSNKEIAALYEQDRPVDLDGGLVASYRFAGNALDLSGHGRHGTIQGATPTADQHGVANGACELDGIDDCIYFGPVLPDMNEMTLSMWVYSYYSDTVRNWTTMFCDGDWESGKDVILTINKVGSTHKVYTRADKNGFRLDVDFNVAEELSNRWMCVTWAMTAAGSSVYADGRKLFQVSTGGCNRGNHNLILGTEEYPQGTLGWNGWWKGKISSVRIYDRPLQEAEIVALYEKDMPEAEPVDLTKGLVAHYPMDEGSGVTLLDASGNKHNGALTRRGDPAGSVRWIDSLPGMGKAMAFPSMGNQYVDAGTWDPSQGTGQLTVAFWMNWSGPNGDSQGLVAKRSTWDTAGSAWQIMLNAGNGHNLGIYRYNLWPNWNRYVAPDGQWEHATFTVNGETAVLYVNGKPVQSMAFSLGPAPNAKMVIGVVSQYGSLPFNGALDDLRFYNRVLTPAEVWALAAPGR